MYQPTIDDFVKHRQPIIVSENRVYIIDQTSLPYIINIIPIDDWRSAVFAIQTMQIRGAPLIGIVAAFGLALAVVSGNEEGISEAFDSLASTRPTAVNLQWALDRVYRVIMAKRFEDRAFVAWQEALAILEEDREQNRLIGRFGVDVLGGYVSSDRPLQIMTHCNAGWLATGGNGTALAPIYAAIETGIPLHVWVSETRPRNQGLLTEWELRQAGVPHTYVVDNAAGLLLKKKYVDLVIVGADRIAANGDVANKIGTYLKALACRDNDVPFFVAAPRSTFDFSCGSGDLIQIEERHGDEIRVISDGANRVSLLSDDSVVSNFGFDITPAGFIKSIITDRGVFDASAEGVLPLSM